MGDFFLLVGVRMKANGKMVKDMVWELKQEADGSIEENGRKALKDVTEFVNRILPQQNMKVLGRMDCKMDTDRRRMLTMVSK